MADVKHFDEAAALAAVEQLFWRRGVAATGIRDVVAATGLSRSSLYNAFGGKDELYLAAVRRYLDHRSRPMFERLAADERGLPAVAAFFDQLLGLRCAGEFAGWGCLVSNANADNPPAAARPLLAEHHAALRDAFAAALRNAELRDGVRVGDAAELLTLLAYAVNLRSRSGATRAQLEAAVDAALAGLGR
ncbi:TetR/AcrR family transcriptional regulator [Kribbella turkmenica]|uniref:TetR/AcrR family transcriptional regulator n=1 Tax=Kribbella turkmenica TaxID=2530375 RepID=A0A4V2YE42_9ACTN|nr:TetR/AcrR family transcriptional regulator [Kribbella turkmenica]TDD17876.1 TetR/AcrR family transcriptional regulator [Kribbella turkmenica]